MLLYDWVTKDYCFHLALRLWSLWFAHGTKNQECPGHIQWEMEAASQLALKRESCPQHGSLGAEFFPGKLSNGNRPLVSVCSLMEALHSPLLNFGMICYGSSLRHQVRIQMKPQEQSGLRGLAVDLTKAWPQVEHHADRALSNNIPGILHNTSGAEYTVTYPFKLKMDFQFMSRDQS